MKLLLVLIVLGALVYLTVRVIQRGAIAPSAGHRPRGQAGPRQQRRVIAPDDDPDFLRDLDRKRRHNHQDDSDA